MTTHFSILAKRIPWIKEHLSLELWVVNSSIHFSPLNIFSNLIDVIHISDKFTHLNCTIQWFLVYTITDFLNYNSFSFYIHICICIHHINICM